MRLVSKNYFIPETIESTCYPPQSISHRRLQGVPHGHTVLTTLQLSSEVTLCKSVLSNAAIAIPYVTRKKFR
jgi:hypothetical protein